MVSDFQEQTHRRMEKFKAGIDPMWTYQLIAQAHVRQRTGEGSPAGHGEEQRDNLGGDSGGKEVRDCIRSGQMRKEVVEVDRRMEY